ncbi:arylamine N-acetyltransferase 1 [Rhodotorula diobovata]|uniref:Arylamine N-acetyltransferase 1 n=1 Tax=Rhodotorula diobovata TaxID=5288 RepID=A0A5C5FZY6_9BASI|nr:arylamine N-acetyltransferase 1 [Rhodotorula diobovata]
MADPWPVDPWAQATLSQEQVEQYLDRIALPRTLAADEPPSLDLLRRVMVAHLEQVAKDTSPLHVPEEQWDGPSDTPIKLSSAFTNMPESTSAFDRVVVQRKGAFCFAINALFAALLRSLGFRVSELAGRTFKDLGNDPTERPEGWKWGTLTHELLVADWPGGDARWVVDGAWGPWGCPVPLKLEDGAQTLGLNLYEGFQLRHEPIPLGPTQTRPIDSMPGWTLYRFIPPPDTPLSLPLTASPSTGFWSPQFHFHLLSVPLADFRLYHHFSASHEMASFTAFFLVTRLLPGTGGARRSLMYADKEGSPRRAKVYTTGGTEGRGSLEGRDVEWVDMETGALKQFLQREFGFGFP